MAEERKEQWVEFSAAMVEAPCAFLEMEEEAVFAHTAEFEETKLGVTPKAFAAVDGSPACQPPLFPSAASVVLAAGKLVVVVINTMVLVTTQDQAVAGLPAVGVNGGLGKDLSPDDRRQLSALEQF